MKHSKAILGIITFLLAIAGVLVAKAHKFINKKFGFYSVGGININCTRVTSVKWLTNGMNQAQTTGNIHGVFTGKNCLHPLYDTPLD